MAVLQQVNYGRLTPRHIDPFNERELIYFQTDQLTLYNPGMAPLHIDGEPVSTDKEFNIKILPKAFRLLQPSGSF